MSIGLLLIKLKAVFFKQKLKVFILTLLAILSVSYYYSLPPSLFPKNYSTVLLDKDGQLLAGMISPDEQWRFAPSDSVPEKFKASLLIFEDKYFENHPGFNPFSIARAAFQNIKQRRIVSGGSTLTMQLVRLSRNGKARTFYEKLVEVILATRLELKYSKKEVLNLYVSHAPFGGNIVGLNAAAWRYYGRSPFELSWAEAAALAILPNTPSMIFPGKKDQQLLIKRNRLLTKLHEQGYLDKLTLELALSEPLPEKPLSLPLNTSHLLSRSIKEGQQGKIIHSTIDKYLQDRVTDLIDRHHQHLRGNEIHNASAIIIEIATGNVLAYIGNTKTTGERGQNVDIITSPRSTGSILKPVLYALMLDEGLILPGSLVPDIPTYLKGFAPKNYTRGFDGAVPADRALARSLNVPAVRMLQEYGVEKLHFKLSQMGMTTLYYHPSHYGLSLILGGAEGTLWEITSLYASMGRTLRNYFIYPVPRRYNKNDYYKPVYIKKATTPVRSTVNPKGRDEESYISAGSIFSTFTALLEVNRPLNESHWKQFSSSQRISWKTGTSFGHRDAWAVGLTRDYAVGVWVGNASGEGRPGMTGVEVAAPILFDIFDLLPYSSWFERPESDMKKIPVCRQSGYKTQPACEQADTIFVPKAGITTKSCPYHEIVHLDKEQKYRVTSQCESIGNMMHKSWFILPPVQEWYYKSKNANYISLPPFKPGCEQSVRTRSIDLIYPRENTKVFIPRELDGSASLCVLEAAHRDPSAELYWHLDNEFLGTTKRIHQMGINSSTGIHKLTLVDESGETLEAEFEIISNY